MAFVNSYKSILPLLFVSSGLMISIQLISSFEFSASKTWSLAPIIPDALPALPRIYSCSIGLDFGIACWNSCISIYPSLSVSKSSNTLLRFSSVSIFLWSMAPVKNSRKSRAPSPSRSHLFTISFHLYFKPALRAFSACANS